MSNKSDPERREDESSKPASPGWGDLSLGARLFFLASGLLALLIGLAIGVFLTFSSHG